MANQTIRTAKNRKRFLEALADLGSVRQAVEVAGISRDAVYLWRNDDPVFAADWLAATERGIDSLEDEVMRRAHATSDTLAIFMLKSRRRHVYGDRLQTTVVHTESGDNRRLALDVLERAFGAIYQPMPQPMPLTIEAEATVVDAVVEAANDDSDSAP